MTTTCSMTPCLLAERIKQATDCGLAGAPRRRRDGVIRGPIVAATSRPLLLAPVIRRLDPRDGLRTSCVALGGAAGDEEDRVREVVTQLIAGDLGLAQLAIRHRRHDP